MNCTMISEGCDFENFLEAVKDRGGIEILQLTNEEATCAQRKCLTGQDPKTDGICSCDQYTEMLKGFILYLRHGVKVSSIKDVDLSGFSRVFW